MVSEKAMKNDEGQFIGAGLNPCFNGIWSLRYVKEKFNETPYVAVLILVLMEYGL